VDARAGSEVPQLKKKVPPEISGGGEGMTANIFDCFSNPQRREERRQPTKRKRSLASVEEKKEPSKIFEVIKEGKSGKGEGDWGQEKKEMRASTI